MSETSSLAERTLERLRSYAKGNGIASEDIKAIKISETVHTVEGLLTLTPSFQAETRAVFGKATNKSRKVLPSFAALQEELARLKEEFEKNDAWLAPAREEIEKEPGHGWGAEEADIVWPDQKTALCATETCPACQGRGKTICPRCRGEGSEICIHCQGRGQELCYHCQGTGKDGLNPGKTCPICHGAMYINCRFCYTLGKTPCPECHGKGGQPCPSCGGTGFVTQEVDISRGAKIHFSLGRTTDLPSGLMRMMQRIGEDKLAPAHMDVTLHPPAAQPEMVEEQKLLRLTARVPYAEIRLKIGKKESDVIVFGKQGRLSNVPAFLDEALAPARKILQDAVKGHKSFEKAITPRLMKEALNLVLAGQAHPNHLRRLYPIGLSGGAAQEIMGNISRSLSFYTAEARAIAGSLCALLSAVLFAGFFFSSLPASMSGSALLAVKTLLPLGAMGLTWLALHHAARWALSRRYPGAKIGATQRIGKTGIASLAAVAILYGLFLLVG